MRAFFVCAALFVAGCPANDPATGLTSLAAPDALLDYNQFVCAVEPVLIKRCSYLACHGQPDHAFRVYSLGKLRLGDATTRAVRSNSPLTTDEVERNFESAAGMAYGATASERQQLAFTKIPLLYKPLAARLGGGEHHGVAVFPIWGAQTLEQDPEWNALAAWVQGAAPLSDSECAAVFDLMGLSPRTKQ